MKKHLSAIIAFIVTCTTCASLSLSAGAYYIDNDGGKHDNWKFAIQAYSNPSDYFYEKYGWGENTEHFPIKRNNSVVAQLVVSYNPELFGSEFTYSWVGTLNGTTGFYMDSALFNKGKTSESKTKYANGVVKSSYVGKHVKNESACTYYANIYW